MGLPPAPPRCECVNANHNSLKLKWGEGPGKAAQLAELCHYTLEMENSRNQFHVVYSGSGVSHKVSKLAENRTYKFRLCASNEAGQGPFSTTYEFKTAYAHPPAIKAPPKVTSITDEGCTVEWSPIKPMSRDQSTAGSELQYQVQLAKVRDNDAKIIYTGCDTQCRVNGLDGRTEYSVRVAGVRVVAAGVAVAGEAEGRIELPGAYSPPGTFTTDPRKEGAGGTPTPTLEQAAKSAGGVGSTKILPQRGDKSWSDQQWATVILFGFTIFALLTAFIMQQVIGWGIVST